MGTEAAQGEIEFTVAQLTGEEEPESTEGQAEAKPEDAAAPKPDAKPADEGAEGEKPKPDAAAKPEDAKPEDRRVPLKDFITERQKRQSLEAEIAELRKKVSVAEPGKDPSEMILEDPQGAMRAMMERIEFLQSEINRRDLARELHEKVPDFFDVAPKMEETLLGAGMSEESIQNVIKASGPDVVKLFKVIADAAKKPDGKALRESIIAEITPVITAQIMEKFKITEPGKNIGKLPGAPPDGKLIVNDESDLEKLTPEQRHKWLVGEL
jgi:hypothetical protein